MKEMNKTMAWIAAALLLTCATSCLEGGSNSVESDTVGIIRRESKEGKMVMDNPFPYGPFYSPSLSKLNDGACVLVHFTLDRDAAENSSTIVRSRGYSTVTISALAEISKYRIARFSDPGAPDTGKVLKDEVPIKNPVNLIRGYVRGYLFVEHVLNQPSDQRNEWYLTYNPKAEPTVVMNTRIYDIYLRTTKQTAGTKTAVDMAYNNAYYIKNYLEEIARKEKASGYNETFRVRFNYVSDIKNNTPVWSRFERTMPFEISKVLGNNG